MDSNLEKQIKEDQDNCSLYAFSLALEMPDRMAEEPDQTAVVARHGDWVVTEELNFERRIAYRAVLQDQSDKSSYIEWKCWPSKPDAGIRFWLFDKAIKNTKSQNILITFNNSGSRAVDQFEAAASDGHADLAPLFFELVGCVRCNPPTAPHDGPLFLAIRDRKMEFNPAQAYEAYFEIAGRCRH